MDNMVDPALVATLRELAITARKGALATLSVDNGVPHASLVLVAIAADLRPVTLLSDLARHTRNTQADPRVTLLIDGTGATGDPMTGPRVTFEGRLLQTDDPLARQLFLDRHPDAATYAGFADFHVYRLSSTRAYLIEGFGRIHDIPLQSES